MTALAAAERFDMKSSWRTWSLGSKWFTPSGPLILVVLLSLPDTALACSCDWYEKRGENIVRLEKAPPIDASSVEQYPAIFKGRVIQMTLVTVPLPGKPESYTYVKDVVFRVTAAWKGVDTSRVTVRTPWLIGSCGYPFALGNKYLVFAERSEVEGPLEDRLCSRTALIVESEKNLKLLRELIGPATEIASRKDPTPNNGIQPSLGAVALWKTGCPGG